MQRFHHDDSGGYWRGLSVDSDSVLRAIDLVPASLIRCSLPVIL